MIVVARMGLTTRDAAERLRDQLGRAGAPLLGVVANGIKLKRRGRYGKYGYGYGYYGPAPGEQAEQPEAAVGGGSGESSSESSGEPTSR